MTAMSNVEALALFGGRRAVALPSPPAAPPAYREAALAGIRAWLWDDARPALSGRGPIQELEERFRALTGRRYAVAVSSGTAALQLALHAAGVGHGHDVLLPAYDWPAAAAAVLAAGARPVPVDVDLGTGTLAPAALAARITPRARAVIVTHLGGRPADVEGVRKIAHDQGLAVVEDCAQALGAAHRDRPVGSYGDLATFSLGPNKLVSAGEGGILVTDDPLRYEAVVRRSQHPLYQRLRGVEPEALHLNHRLHPCAAILALPQVDGLPTRLARRRANAAHLTARLQQQNGIILPSLPAGTHPSWWTFAARYDAPAWGVPRAVMLAALQAEGVPVAPAPITLTICDLIGAPPAKDQSTCPQALAPCGTMRCAAHHPAEKDEPCCPIARAWCKTAIQLGCPDAEPEDFADFAAAVSRAWDKVYRQRDTLR